MTFKLSVVLVAVFGVVFRAATFRAELAWVALIAAGAILVAYRSQAD